MTKLTDKKAFQMIHDSHAAEMPGYDDHLIVWCHPAVNGVRDLPSKAKNHDGCWVWTSHHPRYSPLATDLTAREVSSQRAEAARDFH